MARAWASRDPAILPNLVAAGPESASLAHLRVGERRRFFIGALATLLAERNGRSRSE